MLNEQDVQNVIGSTAVDRDGDKIGKVGQLFLDDETGRPEFVTVNTGLFGNKETFVPAADATIAGDQVTLPFDKATIKDAPNVDAEGGHLDHDEERRLYEYYGMGYDKGGDRGFAGTGGVDTGTTGDVTGRSTSDVDHTVGHDTSGPTTDDAMTRSEEQLHVGTTQQEAGRARLRKYVTTEQETRTVPVRKEHAVIETEPITDGNVGDATTGPAISDEEHEVVLHEEEVRVDKDVKPVERVRLGTETTTEEETVTEEVRKEHIESEGNVQDRR
jgi:uncharacterized protein (TIGR02271 family)